MANTKNEENLGIFDKQEPQSIINVLPLVGGVHGLVQRDIAERFALGVKEYGGTLDPFNGRNALQDLYEELLDACCYLKQALIEQEQTLAH